MNNLNTSNVTVNLKDFILNTRKDPNLNTSNVTVNLNPDRNWYYLSEFKYI